MLAPARRRPNPVAGRLPGQDWPVEIAQAAATLMSAPEASFWAVDQAEQRLRLLAWSNTGLGADHPISEFPFGSGFVGWVGTVLASGLTVVFGMAWFARGGQTPSLPPEARFMPLAWPGATALADVPVIGPLYGNLISGHNARETPCNLRVGAHCDRRGGERPGTDMRGRNRTLAECDDNPVPGCGRWYVITAI